MSNRVSVQWHDVEFVDPPEGRIILFWCESIDRKFPRRMDERMQTGWAGKTMNGSWLFCVGGNFAYDLGLKIRKWAYLPDGPDGEDMEGGVFEEVEG